MSLENRSGLKVLILAAGYATRLYPVTLDLAKPLLKIGKKSIIDFSVRELNNIKEIDEIFVVTNNKFYKDFCSWKERLNSQKKVTIINDRTKTEGSKLGAVGDIYYVIETKRINTDILVIGGDNIFEDNISKFIKFSQENSPAVSIGIYDLKSKNKAQRYGVVKINKDNKILDFEEKPQYPESSFIATCLYFFPKSTLCFLKEYVKILKLDTDKAGFYIKWLLKKTKLYGFRFRGVWFDIGQIDTYRNAQRYFA